MFVNLTPHRINIYHENGEIVEIPPSGNVLRLEEKVIYKGLSDEGVPVVNKEYKIPCIPIQIEGINYIVSTMVLPYLPQERGDFVAPDTGPGSVVRDSEGNIIGIKRVITHQK